MKTYIVGGAVRDRLLGLPVSDRDHVVIGATVAEMIAAGFKPVGREFPVFLHPVTHEEYALARTERKVERGYAGFVFHADPSVTLEEDLARRDLTINAIAEDEESGALIDPFGGRADLAARQFRHVGPAFAEDPVRLLRVARFAARFTTFDVAPDTLALMRSMTAAGEVDALVPERVWQEVSRGLMAQQPSRMLDVLRNARALQRLLPEVAAALPEGGPVSAALDRAAALHAELDVRFAVLVRPIRVDCDIEGQMRAITALTSRLAVPTACRELALLGVREGPELTATVGQPDASARRVASMERADAFRRPARYRQLIAVVASAIDDVDERTAFEAFHRRALEAVGTVDVGAIARQAQFDPREIAPRVRAARTAAVDRGDREMR